MNSFRLFYSLIILFIWTLVSGNCIAGSPPPPVYPSKILFTENKKQWENFIRYEADFHGGKLFLLEKSFTYVFFHPDDILSLHAHEGKQIDKVRLHSISINPENANPHPLCTASDPASWHSNYFIGSDSSRWASDVQMFSSVMYKNLYPGIDMKFYSSFSDIKYDFIVNPGADVRNIQLDIVGADKLYLKNNNLIIHLSVGDIMEEKPFAYQLIGNEKKEIACRFVLEKNKLLFKLSGNYNKSIPVVIDPTLVFSSYSGSFADNWGFTATYDAAGDLYCGGNINGIGFPTTTGAYSLNYHGGGMGGNGWSCDISIAKFNPTGTTLLYATYLGGSDNEQPQSLVVDGNDDLIIFGTTYSADFPTTIGAYDNSINGAGDIIISKLNSSGNTLIASTFVGGSNDDGLNTNPDFYVGGPLKYNYSDDARGEIIADGNNDYIIGSCSKSANFPTTIGSVHPSFNGGQQDGVVFKINSSLTSMIWNTFIGGSSEDAVYDCVIDNNGDLYISGGTNSANFPTTPGVLNASYQGGIADGFIMHLNSTASSVLQSTFIGTNAYDQVYFVKLDFNGNVYCTGQTEGLYPVTPGVYSNPNSKQFIHKLDPSLSTTIYSTVFGSGSTYPNISPTAFLVDTCENVYVAGWGRCLSLGTFTSGDVNGMPVTQNAYQFYTNGCDFYFFILSRDGLSLMYATYFGGNFSEEHVDGGTSRFDKNGVIYEAVCAGCGGNSDFPTTPGVVSNNNNSFNCNNGVIKLAFNLARTVSSITTSPSSGCSPFTLTFINNSVNSISYLWDFGDGSPTDNSFAPTHTYTTPGVYHAMLVAYNTNSCNQNDTSYALITVTAPGNLPASFTVNPNSICDSMIVTPVISSNWGEVFHWDFGDGFDTVASNPSHQYANDGTYQITLIVSDTTCSMNIDTVSQTVFFSTTLVNADITPLNALNGCAPVSISFSNNSTTSGIHFWDFGDGSPTDTTFNVQHIFSNPGNYNVMFVVRDSLSCNGSDTAFVNVIVNPNIPVVPSFTTILHPLCINPSADYSFNGSGGNVFTWDFGDGNISSGTNVSHVYTDTGSFVVTLTVDDTLCGSTGSYSDLVSFYPPVTAAVAAIGATSGCAPLLVPFTNNSRNNGNYFWNFMDGSQPDTSYNTNHTFNNPGIFDVSFIISNPHSCNISDTDHVIVNVLPSVPVHASFNLITTSTCDSLDATLSFNGSGGNIYSWNFGDGTQGNGTANFHHYSQPGTYLITLSVTDSICNHSDSYSQPVIVKAYLRAGINTHSVLFGCAPQTINFSNSFTSTGNYYWDFGDHSYSDLHSIDHTYNNPGQYHIQFIVSDTNSCNLADSANYNLSVYLKPKASFSIIQNDQYFFSDIEIDDHSSVNSRFYRWEFSDSLIDSTQGPLFRRLDKGGTYNVCLYVTTIDGCIDSTCEDIIVENAEAIYIPSCFTPNGDGINDFFKVYFTGITEIDVMIFNRWGTKIYEYTTLDGSWNGMYEGDRALEDVYVYKVIAKGIVNDHIEREGRVSLIY